jgi:hypothetical protein
MANTPLTALGANCSIITNGTLPVTPTGTNPALVIYFDDIKSVLSWTTASTTDLDPWIATIIQKLADYNTAATTEGHDVVAGQPFLGISTRNNIANRQTQTYTVTAYGTTTVSALDADNLI